MNRLILFLFCAILYAAEPAHAKQIGDFNGDGKINILDVLTLLQHLSGKIDVPEIGHETGQIIVDTVAVRDTVFTYEDGRYEGIFGTWSMLEPFTNDSIRYCFYPDGFFVKVEPTQIPRNGYDFIQYEAGKWDFGLSMFAGRWKKIGEYGFDISFGSGERSVTGAGYSDAAYPGPTQSAVIKSLRNDSLELYLTDNYGRMIDWPGSWALFKRVRTGE